MVGEILFLYQITKGDKYMPRTDFVEKTIFNIEGFNVNFMKNGKNLRGEVQQPSNYIANKASKNTYTVSRFIDKLKKQYPGYDFEVLKADGEPADSRMTLATVRDTYSE